MAWPIHCGTARQPRRNNADNSSVSSEGSNYPSSITHRQNTPEYVAVLFGILDDQFITSMTLNQPVVGKLVAEHGAPFRFGRWEDEMGIEGGFAPHKPT